MSVAGTQRPASTLYVPLRPTLPPGLPTLAYVVMAAALVAALGYAVAMHFALSTLGAAAAAWREGQLNFEVRPARFWDFEARRLARACNAAMVQIGRRYEREHEIAAALQSKLARSLPTNCGPFTFGSRTITGSDDADVGGDFLSFSPINDDCCRLVLGDIEGCGLKAAAEVAEFVYPLEALSRSGFEIPAVLAYANRVALEREITASLAIVRLVPGEGVGRVALAGHEPPLLWRKGTATWERISGRQTLLGVVEQSDYTPTDVRFEPGDLMLLYTDGFASVGPRRGSWSVEDLIAAADEGPRDPQPLADYLVARMPKAADDATIIVLRYDGQGRGDAVKPDARRGGLE
jgi:serine phosphatase RsbU (regulator of sigma subunit)